jgi:hypothetical protein
MSETSNLKNAIDLYQDALFEGADYSDIDDVDLVGDYYDDIFRNTLGGSAGVFSAYDVVGGEGGMFGGGQPSDKIQVDRNAYFSQTNAPQYLQNFTAPATQEATSAAFTSLQNTSDIASTLSDYYGYEITPSEQNLGDFGGNLQSHSGTSKDRLAEFHSFVEPILSEQLPYLQTVEGLSYEDALIEAYKRDPMLQSLYAKYDVTPIRQTDDGSTYLYDPFTFGEIRTLEVKDPTVVESLIKIAPSLAVAAALGPIAGGLTSGVSGAAGSALTGALTGAGTAALTGGDPLTAALTGGLGGFVDPIITGADLGTLGTAGARGLSSAAIAEATGGDPLAAGLIAAGMSYIGDTVAQKRSEGTTVAEEIDVNLPDDVVDSIENKIGEAIDFTSGGEVSEIIDDLTPTYEVLDKIIENVGLDQFNNMSNLDIYEYLQNAGDSVGSNILGIDPSDYSRAVGFFQKDPGLRADLTLESSALTGTSFAPDIFGGTETTVVPFDRPTSTTVNVDVSNLRDPRLSLAEIQAGGGGGGAPATDVTAPAMTSTFAPTSAPAMTMPSFTPAIAPPSTLSSGAFTGTAVLPIAGLMASAATAPTSSVTTTGGGATAPAGGQVSGQEDSTEPSGEGQEGTDASGTEIDGGGEGGTGEGTGTGDGTGAGTGTGTGTGTGSGSGDGAGDGVGSGAYTPQVFEDYKFKGTYQAPELLKLARQYEDYQPSSVLQGLFRGFI